jgi:ATP adenylyltransferase
MPRAPRSGKRRPADTEAPAAGYRLWAPWRYTYLRTAGKPQQCIFCFGDLDPAQRRDRLVLNTTSRSAILLNAYPYNNGHLMIAPRRHVAALDLLQRRERVEINELLARTVTLLRKLLKPDGFNVGANLGRVAGAGFADHLHWHVVPRWAGDHNFMPVLASTRVLSQSLQDSYDQLHPVFKAIKAGLS